MLTLFFNVGNKGIYLRRSQISGCESNQRLLSLLAFIDSLQIISGPPATHGAQNENH